MKHDECDLCPHEFADDGSDVSGFCSCCGARCCAECLPEGNGTMCAACGLDDGDDDGWEKRRAQSREKHGDGADAQGGGA